MSARTYPSKMILFGEYTTILGSGALGLPINKYWGEWQDEYSASSNIPSAFIDHLLENATHFLAIDAIKQLGSAPFYNSNIPSGYGMGSSGALSAAIYDRCVNQPPTYFQELQSQLAIVESYFHGTSSGFDPLISKVAQPIVKNLDNDISIQSSIIDTIERIPIYVFDSGLKRTRKDLVSNFVSDATANPTKYDLLSIANSAIIDAIVSNHDADVRMLFRDISVLQFDLMQDMIVDPITELWKKGLDSDSYYMKICGAGGGGYYYCYLNTDTKIGIDLTKLSGFL